MKSPGSKLLKSRAVGLPQTKIPPGKKIWRNMSVLYMCM